MALALDWDSELDAKEWAEAVASYVEKAFGANGARLAAECAATVCWQLGARSIAFAQTGKRTALVLGADATRPGLLAGALLGTR